MQLSDVLDSLSGHGGSFEARLTEDWAQGRSIFGGIQAALAVRGMRKVLSTEAPLRSLQTTFVAPVAPGAVQLESRVLRAGKNVAHAESRLTAGGVTACVVIGVFGEPRHSVAEIIPKEPALHGENASPTPLPSA